MQNILERAAQFPPLRHTVQKALALVDDTNSSTEDIARAIATDTGLATMILKLANSPFYGVSKQIASLSEACVLIGRFSLRNVILSLSVYDKFKQTETSVIDRQLLWRHSLLTGCIASELATRQGLSKDVAFTAGILHEIGKLILAWADPERYKRVVDYQGEFETSDVESEQPLLNHNHAEVGAMILGSWMVPAEIVTAVEHYPFQKEDSNEPLALVIFAARMLADWALENQEGDKEIPPDLLPDYAMNSLKIELEELEAILRSAQESFNQYHLD